MAGTNSRPGTRPSSGLRKVTTTNSFSIQFAYLRSIKTRKAWRGEKKGELTCNPLGKNPGDIWIFRNVKHNHEEQTVHPAQFPEDMVARIILSTTEPGDVVLDPYMGTGTVAVVARDHERHYMGAEIDKDYHCVALRRLSGLPDANGCFPNLKTLRDYAAATGTPASAYTFDMQVGLGATDRSKAKIFSEEDHLEELERRLAYEESAFSERVRGVRELKHQSPRKYLAAIATPALFDDTGTRIDLARTEGHI